MSLWLKILAVGLVVFGVFLYVVKKRRENEEADTEIGFSTAFKVGITGLMLILFSFLLIPIFRAGPSLLAIGGMCVYVGILAVVATIWVPPFLDLVFGPLFNLFDGGGEEHERVPLLGPIRKARSFQHWDEALELLNEQLEEFPTSYQLQFMKLELLAADMKDLEPAREQSQWMIDELSLSSQQICSVWNSLADWEVSVGRDSEKAKEALNQIVEAFPDSAMQERALDRISRLQGNDAIQLEDNRQPVRIEKEVRDLGLANMARSGPAAGRDRGEELEEEMASLTSAIEMNPRDVESRQRLAWLYGTFHKDLDSARTQYDFLLSRPNVEKMEKIRLLNRWVELQQECGASVAELGATLERILSIQPKGAQADQALNQMARIGYVRASA